MKPLLTIRRLMLATAVIALYLHTWIGGYRAHARERAAVAQGLYDSAVSRNKEEEHLAKQFGLTSFPMKLHEGGPRSGVDWCIPLLPGVLLADSYYSIGPLYGRGGIKIVVFYLAGSFTLCEVVIWVSYTIRTLVSTAIIYAARSISW